MQAMRPEIDSQIANVSSIYITANSGRKYLYFFQLKLHPFTGPFSGTTQMSRYQKGKTNLDFTEARDSEWQWHQLGRMTMPAPHHSVFLQAGCPSYRPTNSVKALKAPQQCQNA